jgi:hypothetical protein
MRQQNERREGHPPHGVQNFERLELALTRLEARIGLVDDVNPALAADNLVIAVPLDERLERIADFHGLHLIFQAHKTKGPVAPVVFVPGL